jgi:hypothetical protein
LLLVRMTAILGGREKPGVPVEEPVQYVTTLNRAVRRRQLAAITEENQVSACRAPALSPSLHLCAVGSPPVAGCARQAILRRLQKSQPTYSHVQWLMEARENDARVQQISQFKKRPGSATRRGYTERQGAALREHGDGGERYPDDVYVDDGGGDALDPSELEYIGAAAAEARRSRSAGGGRSRPHSAPFARHDVDVGAASGSGSGSGAKATRGRPASAMLHRKTVDGAAAAASASTSTSAARPVRTAAATHAWKASDTSATADDSAARDSGDDDDDVPLTSRSDV